MRLGVFGGTFDPVHLGHLLIAELTRETLHLDKILFVPAGDPPHKQNIEKTPAHHRRQMIELAIGGNPCFELNRVDLDRPGPHYSIDTVALLCAEFDISAEDCFFLIGGDSLVDLPTWHKPAQLIKVCRLAVVFRPGYQPDVETLEQVIPGLAARLDWVPMTAAVEVASSAIRARVKAGQSIRYQAPDGVRQYIQQHQLYQ